MFTFLTKAFPLKKRVLSKLVVSLAKAPWGIYLFCCLEFPRYGRYSVNYECTKFFWWLRLSVLIKVTYSVRSI